MNQHEIFIQDELQPNPMTPPNPATYKAFLDVYENRILILEPPSSNKKEQRLDSNVLYTKAKRVFVIDKILGRGVSGNVFLCKEEDPSSGEPKGTMAVKVISLPTGALIPKVRDEYELMKGMHHENIIQVYDYYEMMSSLQPGALFTMKYYENGDLRKFAEECEKQNSKKISIHWIYDFIYQMASVLSFIHQRNVIHRDLKPENIFLEENSEHTCKIVLGDFGLAREFTKSQGLFSQVGTTLYWSPEIASNDEYGSETDIWSLGCVCYELMTLKSKQVERVVTLRQEGALINDMLNRYPHEVPLLELIVKMLNKNREDRPTAEDILNQPYMVRFAQLKQICEYIVQKLHRNLMELQKQKEFEQCIQIRDLLLGIQKLRNTTSDSDELRVMLYNAYILLGERLPEHFDLRPKKPKHTETTIQESPRKRKGGIASLAHPINPLPPSTSPRFRATVAGDQGSADQYESSGLADNDELAPPSDQENKTSQTLEVDIDANVVRKRSASKGNILTQLKGLVGYAPQVKRDNITIKPPNPKNFHHDYHIGFDDKNQINGTYPKSFEKALSYMVGADQNDASDSASSPAITPPENDSPTRGILHRRSTSLFNNFEHAPKETSDLPTLPTSPESHKARSATVTTVSPPYTPPCTPPIRKPLPSIKTAMTNSLTPSTPSNSEILKISPRFEKKNGKYHPQSDHTVETPPPRSTQEDENGVPLGAFRLLADLKQDALDNYIEEACNSPTVSRRKQRGGGQQN